MFHFHVTGVISSSPIIHRGWMFVDFFFVLSGVIIASNYIDKIKTRSDFKAFMILRIGRIYPLHIFVLVLFLAMETVALSGLIPIGSSARQPFESPNTIGQLLASVTFMNVFGIFDTIAWNGPSWSISAEFWSYIVFGVVMVLGRRWWRILFAGIAVVSVIWLARHPAIGLDATFEDGVFRALYGFGLGALVAPVAMHRRFGGTISEIAIAALCILFVIFIPKGLPTLVMPVLFTAAVLIFSGDKGLLSQLLATRPFQIIGALSYSTYMFHVFLQARLYDVFTIGQRFTGTELVSRAGGSKMLVLPAPLGDLVMLLMLALLIGVAMFTYRFVEQPCRAWARKFARLTAPAPA